MESTSRWETPAPSLRGSTWYRVLMALALAAAAISPALSDTPVRSATAARPRSSQLIDLGALLPESQSRREVVIKNDAAAAIQVRRVFASCGCTRAWMKDSRIGPRGSATLEIRLVAPAWAGPGAVRVFLWGECDGKPWRREFVPTYRVRRLLRVRVHGRELAGVEGYLNLGGTGFPQVLALQRGGYPARWTSLGCAVADKLLAASVKRQSKGSWTLTLTRRPPYYFGSQSSDLHFAFFLRRRVIPERLSIPVSFRVTGPVDLSPDSVFFGMASAGRVLTERVRLWVASKRNERAYHITAAAASDPAHVKTRITPGGRAVLLSLHTGGLVGRVQGHVVIVVSRAGKIYRFREDYLGYVLRHQVPPKSR